MKRILAITLVIGLCLTLFAGCSGSGASSATASAGPSTAASDSSSEKTVIKIGVLLPFSGSSSYYAENQFYGIKYALDHFMSNSDYDTSNISFELVTGDSTGIADTAVTEFERLVNQENVSAVIGPYNSGAGAAIAPLAIKYQVPLMVTNAISDIILSQDSDYVYRCNLGDADGNESFISFMQFLIDQPDADIESVAMVYENSDYGNGMYKNMSANVFPTLGLDLVLAEPFTSDSGDLSSVVNKVKTSGADIVCVSAFTNDALLFTRQMAEYEVDIPILGFGGGFSADDYLKQAGDLCQYVLNSSSWIYDPNSLTAEAQEICDRYLEESGNTIPNETFANGWMGMYTLLDSIYRAGSGDRQAIADAINVTDIPAGHPALMFHTTFQGIQFGDFLGRYNQNKYCGQMFAQCLDGTYKIVFPVGSSGESDLIFPYPTYAER